MSYSLFKWICCCTGDVNPPGETVYVFTEGQYKVKYIEPEKVKVKYVLDKAPSVRYIEPEKIKVTYVEPIENKVKYVEPPLIKVKFKC